MTARSHLIPASVLHSFLRVGAAFGIDAGAAFARAGLPLGLASLGDRFITVAEFDRVVDAFTAESGDPAFALHLGEMFNLFDLAILTTLINTSRTLAEAAAAFADFRALFNPLFHLTIVRDGAQAVVAYRPTPGEPLSTQPRYAEFVLAFHLSYARWLLREPIVVRAARFRHPRPAYVAEYDRVFACPVAFDADLDCFEVDAAALDRPLGSAFAEYNRQAAELARAELSRLPNDATVPQVIQLIRVHLADGTFDLDRTARELGVAGRTLQRRLQDAGVSFTGLRDQVRSQAALALVRRMDLTIDQVAEQLGYAERSNFTHAFSRWTGMTPGAFRRRLSCFVDLQAGEARETYHTATSRPGPISNRVRRMPRSPKPPLPVTPKTALADGRLRTAIELLESIAADRALLATVPEDERVRFLQAAGRVSRPDARVRRQVAKAARRHRRQTQIAREESVLAETGIRKLRREVVFTTPNVFPPADFAQQDVEDGADLREPIEPKHCYVCKEHYATLHHFYDQLCPPCAELNFAKRSELADLRGRVALLTGGRVKIGYQAGIKLLRAGAQLIVTTRFPRDSAARYAKEPDFADWGRRLEIFGLDLRHTPSVEAFCRHLLKTRDRLDFIVNNACQTVRRPPDFYRHMMAGEHAAAHELPPEVRALLGAYEGVRGYHMLPEGERETRTDLPAVNGQASDVVGLTHAAALSQLKLLPEEIAAQEALFPEGCLDQDMQQIDLRDRNSWRMLLADVPAVELLEVQLVNAVAPFILNARLKPLLLRTPERDKHIVNVSAVEGQFYRRFKTTRHPHTNMAKAALNMMTRTSATDYKNDGIHMNSVDTGWVTDEDPAEVAARKTAEHRFHPPLDIVDGAARIVDPIIAGFNTGEHVWGQFLRNYRPTDW